MDETHQVDYFVCLLEATTGIIVVCSTGKVRDRTRSNVDNVKTLLPDSDNELARVVALRWCSETMEKLTMRTRESGMLAYHAPESGFVMTWWKWLKISPTESRALVTDKEKLS